MNVMALLEYLDEELSKSATVPLTGKRLVDVEKCLDIVSELRVTLPDDVKDAEVIVRDREQILAERSRGKAILLISLELDEIMNLADTIGVIYNGQLLKTAPADTLTTNEVGKFMMGVKE